MRRYVFPKRNKQVLAVPLGDDIRYVTVKEWFGWRPIINPIAIGVRSSAKGKAHLTYAVVEVDPKTRRLYLIWETPSRLKLRGLPSEAVGFWDAIPHALKAVHSRNRPQPILQPHPTFGGKAHATV